MKKTYTLIIILVFFAIISFTCNDSDDMSSPQQDELAELITLKTEIISLANKSICNETTECKFIGLGAKPCGGPLEYLVYSTSINTTKLTALVKDYNKKNEAYNTKWNIASDCAVTTPPTSLNCKNNTCIAEY
ncbi:hypothetical protein [Cognatitamlana onchidii]|uniref:hypothetical protein n=1 Tax=Cognatitamlana onchidii TaxID=2562860 RepID=UPI0010A5C7D8|nr:hypothetical protein [Algibacter onchidii]